MAWSDGGVSQLVRGPFRVRGRISWLRLCSSVFFAEGVGLLAGVVSRGSSGYGGLHQPSWAPPAWVFPVVWPVLYLLMGVAAYRVWMYMDHSEARSASNVGLTWYLVQIILNFLWPVIFFRWGLRDFAFFEIVFLWAAIVATSIQFARLDGKAARLMIPYIVWVSYASALSYSMWQLNRGH